MADDEAGIAFWGECLRRLSIRQIDQATDGEAALGLFLEHKHALAVLQLHMPRMSGLDVLRRIRTIDPHTQVVIVAAHATKEQAIEALNLHAFGLLEIPFSFQQIQTMLAEAYAQYQQLAGMGPGHEAEIAALYEQLASLSAALERSPEDTAIRQAHERCLEQLREMQRQEAEFASQLFRQNLALKRGAGYASIEAARRLLDRTSVLPSAPALPSAPIDRRHAPESEAELDRGYERFRPCLRWEFSFACPFCLLHEAQLSPTGAAGAAQFWIEHLEPQAARPDLRNTYANVVYACRRCNLARHQRPRTDGRGRRLLDPCADAWSAHFGYEQDELVPLGPDAQYTATAYDINSPPKVALRRDRREAIDEALYILATVPALLDEVMAGIAS